MATPPDFTTGQVLTAAQMNQIGLWKIIPTGATNGTVATNGDVTVGTTVASVTINDAFSANYRNYKILISGVDCTNGYATKFQLRLNNSGNHYGSMYGDSFNGLVSQFFRTNAANQFDMGFSSQNDDANITLDILNPQIALRTTWNGLYNGATLAGWFGGYYDLTTQFTGITFLVSAGTMTGGKIQIYGYN